MRRVLVPLDGSEFSEAISPEVMVMDETTRRIVQELGRNSQHLDQSNEGGGNVETLTSMSEKRQPFRISEPR